MATALILPFSAASFANSVAPTVLSGPTDGVLQIFKSTGANPTTLVSGLVVGPASASGVSWVYDGTAGNAGWRAMTGNMGANAGINASGFGATGVGNVLFGVNVGVASQTGMGHPSLTSIAWYVSNTQYGLVDANGKWSNLRPLTASKTTSYSVVAADSFTRFDNTGAGGTVVTFTLPAAALGLTYSFSGVLTTALAQIVITPQAADTIAFGTKIANQSVSGPIATRSSISVTCTAANTWAVTSVIGTFT